MKFDLASDLHLESGGIKKIVWEPGADVLLLAGDITEIFVLMSYENLGSDVRNFMQHLSKQYKNVYWVFGNHEYYKGDLNTSMCSARYLIKDIGIRNIQILENDTVEFDDCVLFGSTMWTSFDNGNPVAMTTVQMGMNDYRYISLTDKNGDKRKIIASDTYKIHQESRECLDKFIALKTDKAKVVMTHHALCSASVPEEFIFSELNPAYYTDLSNELYDSDIKLAVHGHMHSPSDYCIGISGCRIVANPRGYNRSRETVGWKIKTLEV